MLSANLLNTIKALALEQRPLVTVTAVGAAKTGLFEPGQKLQGSVQAQVAPGLFKVRIGDQVIQMQLPATIKSGDTVALQVMATQPRFVFSMSASTNPLSTPEQLSSASRLLSALSQQQPEKAYVRATQKTPLWPVPQAPDSAQLAGQLREALSYSGLFYESHQAQWLQGARSTAELMQEPQNLPSGQTAATADAAEESSFNPALRHTPPLPQDGGAADIPEHLQSLVQQQLNALETRQMVWQGNIWPGQPMQWEIHEHEQPPQASEAEGLRQWTTLVNLALPRLGEISAKLHFGANGLNLALEAGTAMTRATLSNAAEHLISSLAENGIQTINMQVVQHAPAE